MDDKITKEIEAAALSAWSHLIDDREDLDTDLNKRMFVCGVVCGAPFGREVAERVIAREGPAKVPSGDVCEYCGGRGCTGCAVGPRR